MSLTAPKKSKWEKFKGWAKKNKATMIAIGIAVVVVAVAIGVSVATLGIGTAAAAPTAGVILSSVFVPLAVETTTAGVVSAAVPVVSIAIAMGGVAVGGTAIGVGRYIDKKSEYERGQARLKAISESSKKGMTQATVKKEEHKEQKKETPWVAHVPTEMVRNQLNARTQPDQQVTLQPAPQNTVGNANHNTVPTSFAAGSATTAASSTPSTNPLEIKNTRTLTTSFSSQSQKGLTGWASAMPTTKEADEASAKKSFKK